MNSTWDLAKQPKSLTPTEPVCQCAPINMENVGKKCDTDILWESSFLFTKSVIEITKSLRIM